MSGLVVEETPGGVLAAAEGEAKWIVRVEGPDWSAVRFTVMGMEGLWYFSRGRILRQKCLWFVRSGFRELGKATNLAPR
jgi:hypothetical protein